MVLQTVFEFCAIKHKEGGAILNVHKCTYIHLCVCLCVYIEAESCLQVVTAVAVHSDAALQAAHDSGLLPALIAELDNSDILLQMNALELLTKLAVFESGLQYLRQYGVVTALANRVTAISEDPLASLSLPGDLLHTVCVCVSC